MAPKEGSPEKRMKGEKQVEAESKSFTPREYQIEILEAAMKQNTIACLGTGTGKTFIAVMLIRENAKEVRVPYEEGGKRIFFLVPTVPLVTQQAKTVEEHTNLRVKGYYGEMDVDSWNKEQWVEEFVKSEVLVMTAEIFRIIVDHTFIPVNRIQLLIIDECHRAQKDHPYRLAMKRFISLDTSEMPRVFGLSASLLNGKCKPTKLEEKLRQLEMTLRSRIVTASDLADIRQYGTDPSEYLVLHRRYEGCADQLAVDTAERIRSFEREKSDFWGKQMSKDADIQFFDKPLKALKALELTLASLGPWCAGKAAEVYSREANSLLGRLRDEGHRDVLRRIIEFLRYFREVCGALVASSELLSDGLPSKLLRLLQVFSAARRSPLFRGSDPSPLSPVEVAFEDDPEEHRRIIEERRRRTEESQLCSLIFVEQRVTAYVLCEWLREVAASHQDLAFLRPEFVVGHGNMGGGSEIGMSERIQQRKLKEFRENKYNVLIATQVLEEGMDIRQCNLVVRFDPPGDFRSYVQSKGRARSRNSIYVVLIQEGENHSKFLLDLCNFKTIEELLVSKCHDRNMPTEEEFSEHMADDVIPPYMPQGPDGPKISITSAISLINRYCASLPSDMATKLVPKWDIHVVDEENIDKEYECILRMPINSCLRKPIVSDAMRQKRLAKMSAALKACKMLDEIGELNENLIPISCLVDKALEQELGGEEEEADTYGAIPGTNRRRQVYDKKVPVFLKDARPVLGMPCYLHVITMNLVFPLPKELNPRNRPILDPANTSRGLAILTTNKLPPVNPFPIFTKHGKIMITITISKTRIVLENADIKKIEQFHRFIFTDALCIEDNKLFSPDSALSAYYVVPVNKGDNAEYDIDWHFIDQTIQHPYHEHMLKTSSTVERMVFKEEDFVDAVVLRSYKMDMWKEEPRTFHHVVKIMHDMSPRSNFLCNAKDKTFREYFYRKYGVAILSDDQPLLETVQSGGLHLWKPIYQSAKETFDHKAKLSKSKEKHRDYREYLVPELSIVHPFPSTFFTKVLCVPTALFRLHGLLLAEELRQSIAREASVGRVEGSPWPPFNLETSDRDLTNYLRRMGIMGPGSPEDVLVPRDIVKDGDRIVSFQNPVDLGLGPEPRVLIQALTPRSTGDEFDLERLEMIGDSFLKYAMTVKTYIKYHAFDEGKLTKLRIGLLQNATLYRRGKRKGLAGYMTTVGFNCRKTWLPPCYHVEEVVDPKALVKKTKKRKDASPGSEDNTTLHLYFTKQVISDKCIADSVEALIGAFLLSCGQQGALRFMAWFGLNPSVDDPNKATSDDHEPTSSGAFSRWPPAPPCPVVVDDTPDVRRVIATLTDGCDRLERRLGYRFRNRAYLLQALTHPSYTANTVTDCYQRLEFLGDAVLDYLITRQLYEDPSGHSPGMLTDLRSALVNNIYFAYLAVHYEYHKYLLIMSHALFQQVSAYVRMLKESEVFKFFEENLYVLEELECFDLQEVEVPKALGDVFESIAGAIYLDSGMSLDTVWKVCYPMIEPAMRHLCQHVPKSPVRELYELAKCQKVFGKPTQKEEKTYIEAKLPDGRSFSGVGPNKAVAKRSAAKRALAALKQTKAENVPPLNIPKL